MQNYNIYLREIFESIEKIENSLNEVSKNDFIKNSEKIDSILMRIQIIGENLRKVPFEIKKKMFDEWRGFEKARNIISHAYSKINLNIVWDLVKNEIPKLKEEIKKLSKK